MKRTLALLLAVLMLICSLAACKKEPEKKPTVSDDEIEESLGETDEYGQTIIDNGIPASLDYKGAAVNILVRDHISRYGDWVTDEGADDPLSLEIYERNEYIAEQLGIEFNFIKTPTGENGATINSAITNSWTAQMGGIDIVSNYQHFGTSAAILNCYKNLYSEEFTYLNLEQPWWNQNFISAAEAFNSIYLVVGDMNLAVYKTAFTMYFNQVQCEARGIMAEDLYDLVLEGKWTIAQLMNYTKETRSYLDEAEPLNDFYGLDTVWESHAWDGWVAAFDMDLTYADPDTGEHSLITDSAMERLVDAGDLLSPYLNSADVCLRKVNSGENTNVFAAGRAMFGLFSIGEASGFKDQMTEAYGLLPMPKYIEEQDGYYGGVQDSHDAVSVLSHPKQNYEMISAVLEMLNSTSYYSVRPYFIETLVKFRYVKDSESGQVIDMILAGTRWDFSDIYAVATGEIRNNMWREPLKKGAAINPNSTLYNALLQTMDGWLASKAGT